MEGTAVRSVRCVLTEYGSIAMPMTIYFDGAAVGKSCSKTGRVETFTLSPTGIYDY